MDRSSLLLATAIFMLLIIYLTSFAYPYLFINEIILTNVFALVAALLIFLAYVERNKRVEVSKRFNIYLVLAITLFFILLIFQYLGGAVIMTLVGIAVFGHFSKKMDSHKLYAFMIAAIVITSALSVIFIVGLWGVPWSGIDEIAYSFYASYFLIHGKNPYLMNMTPSLAIHNTRPTIQLNGTTESRYNYPAFSLVPTTLLLLLGINAYFSIAVISALIIVGVSFFIYRKSGYNNAVLLPLTVWIAASYFTVPTIDHYIAVAVLLLLAYVFRKKTIVYAILLGLAASTIQLAWFAIPFFYILTYREEGKKKLAKVVLISIAVFILINSYFILQAPGPFIYSIFSIFGTSKLMPLGANIAQFFLRSYVEPFWIPALIAMIVFATLMVLFYFYTATLRPLIAIAPAFIFFLTWRNLEYYGLAFVPLMILLCYLKEKGGVKDAIKKKRYILFSLAGVALVCIAIVVYAHGPYSLKDTLSINRLDPVLHQNANGTYAVNAILVNISNNGDSNESVSFLYFSSDPAAAGFTLNPLQSESMPPGSSRGYTLNTSIKEASNRTQAYVLVFSKDYITWGRVHINDTKSAPYP